MSRIKRPWLIVHRWRLKLAAVMHKTYEMTWKRIIEMANWDFALGVNQVCDHCTFILGN